MYDYHQNLASIFGFIYRTHSTDPLCQSPDMQKVVAKLPSWDKTKTQSKKGFDKAWGWADKLGAPINRLSNRIGSEAFWPTTLDKESDKAARILRSFCSKCRFHAWPFLTNERTP